MSRQGMRHLSAADPRFAALIRRVGPPRLGVARDRDLYEALIRAIAHQQLHGRAAEAILARFVALYREPASPDAAPSGASPPGMVSPGTASPGTVSLGTASPGTVPPGGAFPAPERVLATPEETLRGCGFSAAKLAAVRDICARTLDGTVPTRGRAARLSDADLIARLTAIRGVGRWTVEMLLIFTLGRPDVLPVDDFGVREGYRVLFGLDAQPKPRALADLALPWSPHRSLATWYLYRAVEEARRQGPASRA